MGSLMFYYLNHWKIHMFQKMTLRYTVLDSSITPLQSQYFKITYIARLYNHMSVDKSVNWDYEYIA